MTARDIRYAEAVWENEGPHIRRVGCHTFTSTQKEARHSELKEFLLKQGLQKRLVCASLPRHRAIVHFLSLPSTEEAEIDHMAKMEALKQLPYTEGEIVHGVRVLRKKPEGYSDVLIAMTERAISNQLLETIKEAGLTVEKVALSSEVLFLYFDAAKKFGEKESVLLVHVDRDSLEVIAVNDRRLVFTRGTQLAEGALTNTDLVLKHVQDSLSSYQRESRGAVSKVLLCGEETTVYTYRPLLSQLLSLPVDVFDLRNLSSLRMAETAVGPAVSLAGVIALAENFHRILINLAPEEAIRKLRQKIFLGELKRTAVLFFAIVSLAVSLVFKMAWDTVSLNLYLNGLQKSKSVELKNMKKILGGLDLMRAQVADRPFALEALHEIYRRSVPNIKINFLNWDSDKNLTLRGTTPQLATLFDWVKGMEKSAMFEEVAVKYVNKRKDGDQERTDFEVGCRLAVPEADS